MAMTRQDEILKLIVEDFISTAIPVGSKNLIEKHRLPFSSATVRNDMMELEKEGLIEKTHASSGRVPSSKGYRYYVEHLEKSKDVNVDAAFKKEFQVILAKKSQSVEDVMNQSCEILSQMTSLATVVLGPDAEQEHLISISIVPLSPTAATAIFVTDRGYVENKTFVIKSEQDGKSIIKCVDFLNKRLDGTPVSALGEKIEALKPILNEIVGKSSNIIMESFIEAFMKFAKDRISVAGTSKLMELPEFDEDKKKLSKALDLLSDPEKFRSAISDDTNTSSDQEKGFSYTQDQDDDLAILSQDFDIEGLEGTRVAVVGPQRMNYKKIIGTLEYIADELNKYFSPAGEMKSEDQTPPQAPAADVKKAAKAANKEGNSENGRRKH
jgi:heat-inducible transcriptional repressor